MHKNVFSLPVSCTGSYTEDVPNFPRLNNPILQKMVWHRQGSEFQGFFKTSYIRNQVLFKDLDRIQGLFKTTSKIQDLFKIVQTKFKSVL